MAYADDLFFMVKAVTENEIKGKIAQTFEILLRLMNGRKLEIAVHKTEILVMRAPRK